VHAMKACAVGGAAPRIFKPWQEVEVSGQGDAAAGFFPGCCWIRGLGRPPVRSGRFGDARNVLLLLEIGPCCDFALPMPPAGLSLLRCYVYTFTLMYKLNLHGGCGFVGRY
jgi:hypothetical protein